MGRESSINFKYRKNNRILSLCWIRLTLAWQIADYSAQKIYISTAAGEGGIILQ